MLWPKTGATHYYAHLELLYNNRTIEGLIICNGLDLKPLNLIKGLPSILRKKIRIPISDMEKFLAGRYTDILHTTSISEFVFYPSLCSINDYS